MLGRQRRKSGDSGNKEAAPELLIPSSWSLRRKTGTPTTQAERSEKFSHERVTVNALHQSPCRDAGAFLITTGKSIRQTATHIPRIAQMQKVDMNCDNARQCSFRCGECAC